MQPISILAWAAPFVLLLAYDFTRRSFKSSIFAHVVIIVVQVRAVLVSHCQPYRVGGEARRCGGWGAGCGK